MCGICGILNLGAISNLPDIRLIQRMTDTLRHRGPNDGGVWGDERIALGSRRLSVIDLSRAGRMPMANEDGSIQLVYNGEVYNARELKEKYRLVERGHVFRSRTDTEVLVHLYEEAGLSMVNELIGMFAIAIWDRRHKQLHLVRDRYGIKPLFYQQDALNFRFGSEIKAMLADPRVARKPSIQALHDFLTFDYIPGEQTAFEGIHELPPAHTMTVDIMGSRWTERYWDLEFQPDSAIDEPTAVKCAADLMDTAVQRRLIADVPVGVLLSGGMDSSSILALMHKHVSEPVHTYSIGFEDDSFNELPYARLMASAFRTRHKEVIITPRMVRRGLESYLEYIDEPYGDGSAIPTYYVCELASKEVVVVLSGEGGDEAFAGYETYSAYRAARILGYFPRWLRKGLLTPAIGRLPVSHRKLSLEFKLKRLLGGVDLPPALAHLWWRVVLTEEQKKEMYTDWVAGSFDLEPSVRHFVRAWTRAQAQDDLSRLLYIDSTVFLPDDLMVKNDRMSMAHSLEARVPLTDHELTGFMARVPAKLKLAGFKTKPLMRQAMKEAVPAGVLRKKKVGLEIPYSKWFRNELRDLLLDQLSAARVAESGLFRPQAVAALIDDHLAGRVDNGRALWGLLNYMIWFQRYIAESAPSVAISRTEFGVAATGSGF